ncbi:MAG: hypothetical protein GQ569_11595 [Methylococcaceae bacterium]|nr:hypothetical protein [Methylococcaceae bacterium]
MVSSAILYEGKNDRVFIEEFITHLNFDNNKVQSYIFGGKSNFFDIENQNYQDLRLDIESSQIEKILFIVDADDIKNDKLYGGFENTQTALNKLIQELQFEAIASSYIMCDPKTQVGYLESFILSTIPEQQRDCIERFLGCSQFKSKENHKAILNQIYKIAYPNAPYNFEHSHFDKLKAELNKLFKTE